MRSRRSQLQADERGRSLGQAAALVDYLRAGGRLEPVACPVRLDHGEVSYLNTSVRLWQYTAAEAAYHQSTFIAGGSVSTVALTAGLSAVGNVRRRRAAEAAAAAQWRLIGEIPLLVTDRRLLGCESGRWLSWWYAGIRQVIPHLPQHLAVDLLFEDCPRTRLEGLAAPTIAVMLVHLLYGQTFSWAAPETETPTNPRPLDQGRWPAPPA